MTQNLTSIDPLLKDVYDGPIEDQMPHDVLLYNILSGKQGGVQTRKPIDTLGRRIIVPVHIRRNKGIGAAGEDANLPVAQAQGYADEVITLKYLYGAIRLTAQVMELATGDNEGAFVSATKSEIQGMADGFMKDFNRQCYGDGNGKLATLSANAASGQPTVSVNPTMWIEENDVVDIVDGTGTLITGGLTVKSVTYTTQGTSGMVWVTGVTFTTNLAAAVTSGQFIVRNNGNASANNWAKEVLGLDAAIAKTGSYLNIDPATVSVWQSTVLDNGGSAQNISEKLFQSALANPKRRMGRTNMDFKIITTDGVQSQFISLLAQNKRFNDTKLRGGFTSIDYNGIEVIADTDCQYGTAYVINPDSFAFYHTRPAHWADTGGSIMHWDQTNGAKDAAVGYYRYYVQLATSKRGAHTKITNINE